MLYLPFFLSPLSAIELMGRVALILLGRSRTATAAMILAAAAAHLVLVVATVVATTATAAVVDGRRWWRVAAHHVRIVHVGPSIGIVAGLRHALHGRIDGHRRLATALATKATATTTAAAVVVATTIRRVLRTATATIGTAWAGAVGRRTRALLTTVKVLAIARLVLRPRLLRRHNQWPAFHLFAVEAHGRLHAVLVLELNESGALRVARLHVLYDGDAHNLAAANERVAQLFLGGRVVNIANVDGESVVIDLVGRC